MKKKVFKALIKYPGKPLMETNLRNELEVLQGEVGGHIEVVGLGNDLLMIVNEEGKWLNLPRNFPLGDDIIMGPAIFCGQDGPEFGDVPVTKEGLLERLLEVNR